MAAYYLLLGVPLLLKLFYSFMESNYPSIEYKKRNDKIVTVTFFVIYFFLLALRSNYVGADSSNYEYMFDTINSYSWEDCWQYSDEYGYVLLNKLIGSLGFSYQWFVAIVALITVLPLAKLYHSDCENALFAISIFINLSVFDMFFSGHRQSIAIALAILAYQYTKEKKLLKFLLCVLIAYFFHHSAFAILLMYPVYHVKITKKWIFVIAPIVGLIFLFRRQIFTVALDNFFQRYIDRYGYIQETGAFTVFILFILFMMYTFVAIDDNNLDKETIGLRNILVLATCIQTFASTHALAMRINYYFIPFIPVLMTKVYYRSNKWDRNIVKLIAAGMMLFFMSYFFYKAYTGDDILQLFPYIPFWGNKY